MQTFEQNITANMLRVQKSVIQYEINVIKNLIGIPLPKTNGITAGSLSLNAKHFRIELYDVTLS